MKKSHKFLIVSLLFTVATILVVFVFMGSQNDQFNERAMSQEAKRLLNFRLIKIPVNQWVKIRSDKHLGWFRQAHAGIAFDSKRDRVLIFGSNTHNMDWDNTVHEFDPVSEKWTTHYREAPKGVLPS